MSTHHISEETLVNFAQETLNEAKTIMYNMLTKVVEIGASDLFITADFPPSVKPEAWWNRYDEGAISHDEAIRNADSANELRLQIKLNSKRGEPKK